MPACGLLRSPRFAARRIDTLRRNSFVWLDLCRGMRPLPDLNRQYRPSVAFSSFGRRLRTSTFLEIADMGRRNLATAGNYRTSPKIRNPKFALSWGVFCNWTRTR